MNTQSVIRFCIRTRCTSKWIYRWNIDEAPKNCRQNSSHAGLFVPLPSHWSLLPYSADLTSEGLGKGSRMAFEGGQKLTAGEEMAEIWNCARSSAWSLYRGLWDPCCRFFIFFKKNWKYLISLSLNSRDTVMTKCPNSTKFASLVHCRPHFHQKQNSSCSQEKEPLHSDLFWSLSNDAACASLERNPWKALLRKVSISSGGLPNAAGWEHIWSGRAIEWL